MPTPEIYHRSDGYWYDRTNPRTSEVRPHGPFYSPGEAQSSIDDAILAAIPYGVNEAEPGEWTYVPPRQTLPVIADARRSGWQMTDPDVAPPMDTATDEVDRLIHHIRDTGYTLNEATYSIKLAAGLDAEHDWSTGLIEISYTELQAIRAILALRPR